MAQNRLRTLCGAVWSRALQDPEPSSLWGQKGQLRPCESLEQNLGDGAPEVSCKQNVENRTRQEKGCLNSTGRTSWDFRGSLRSQTPAYKAHLYACPPGISLLCPVASYLWAHTGPKFISFPSPLPSCHCLSSPGLHGIRSPS